MNDIAPKTDHPGEATRQGSPNEILEAVQRVRLSLARLISGSGADPAKTRETARYLDVDRNLIWVISKIIRADDLLEAAKEIPTSKRIEGLVRGCTKREAPAEAVAEVREAMSAFEGLIEAYAGNRESFFDLIQSLTYDDVTTRQEETRRMVYRGQSSIWGVQARLNFKTLICAPCRTAVDTVDVVRLGGLVDLRRLRPLQWSVYRMDSFFDDGSAAEVMIEPLDSASDVEGSPPFLTEFCTNPLPEIRNVVTRTGKRIDIESGAIGNVGAIDCVFGDVIHEGDDEYWHAEDQYITSMLDLQTPSETLLLDFFVHEDLSLISPPELLLLDRLNAPRGFSISDPEWSRLPLSSRAVQLPPGLAGSATPHYPEYQRLLEYAYESLGELPNRFTGFRFLMKYPPTPSAVVLRMLKATKP